MIPYIGDFAEDATIYHYFNTFDSNDPSASVTITNLADTDIYVYKDGSVTDIVTDGASVVIDFDARTGVHKLTIDTSVHADYAIGSDYMVLIEGTTIDAGTVTAGIFTFSIENRYNAAADDLANGTDGLGALKTLIDAVQTVVDKVPVSDGTNSWNATALAAINAEADTAISDASLATAAELTKVPKSDGTTSWNATALAAINAEADTAITDGALATAAELAKVPKSDGTTSWNATALAAINAEADTAISDAALATAANLANAQTDLDTLTDARGEPAQGAPGVSETSNTKLDYLYKAWRNKSTQTATTYSLFADDTTTVDHKATVSDDATTATKGEVATGP